jgi:hypothetical protein
MRASAPSAREVCFMEGSFLTVGQGAIMPQNGGKGKGKEAGE